MCPDCATYALAGFASCNMCGSPITRTPEARKRGKRGKQGITVTEVVKPFEPEQIAAMDNDMLHTILLDGRLFQSISNGVAYDAIVTRLQAAGYAVTWARCVCGRWDN
jgi:hypothetical protein